MRLCLALLALATLPAWSAVSFTLDALPPGPSAVGRRVTLVSYVSGVVSPRYRFEVRNAAGALTYARDWTTGRSTWWTPTATGTYTATALVRSGSAGTPLEQTMSYTINAKLSQVHVDTLSGPLTVGQPFTFRAWSVGGGTVEYRPLIGYATDRTYIKKTMSVRNVISWDQSRPWGLERTWTFTPQQTVGYYVVRIYARERGSACYYDARSIDYVFQPVQARVTDFKVTTTPAHEALPGTAITITATSITGGAQPRWRFVACSRATQAWTLIREYGASPTVTWTVPTTPGEYDIYVLVRESWKTGTDYDVQRRIPFRVLAGQRANPTDGSVLMYVPAGTFFMGEPGPVGDPNYKASPQRTVYLDGYWIMRDEVTVAQYRAFCAATGRAMPTWTYWSFKTGWDDPTVQQYPMVKITWDDAQAYAAWAGMVLPTEAQWEKAARGTDGRTYPWGNAWASSHCANWQNTTGHPQSVGSFPMDASPYGCHDMAGNVLEWCADWYATYDPAATTNPSGPAVGTERVARGGAYGSQNGSYYTTTYRYRGSPTGAGSSLGFRCASPQ